MIAKQVEQICNSNGTLKNSNHENNNNNNNNNNDDDDDDDHSHNNDDNKYIYIYCIINRCVFEYNIRSFSRLIGKLAHRDSLISTPTLLLQSKDPFQKFFSSFTATWWRPHVAASVRSPVISR